MSLRREAHQKPTQVGLPLGGEGEARSHQRSGEARTATHGNGDLGTAALMERVVDGRNLKAALKRVRQNKGSPGVDGMTVSELPKHVVDNWIRLRQQLLDGVYQPKPVRKAEIPKAGGGIRTLGIPSAVDRLIQQALLQVLQPMYDPTFSESSYGFRPGRSAHQAVCAAQRYLHEGKRVVVDTDLEKFFDRVNHDVLMGRLAKHIKDKRVLGLIRRYLSAGLMADGVVVERYEGTPQGGPLSPLLANVLLDEVDKELEKRGLSFVRYADDLNVYVKSRRAGDKAYATLKRLFTKLQLRVNEAKSAVGNPWERKFLGYSFYCAPGTLKPKVAPQALEKMKDRVRELTSRKGGRSLKSVVLRLKIYLSGWKNYFQLAKTPGVFRVIDKWIRHRLRALQFKQWKKGRKTYRELERLGATPSAAWHGVRLRKRWWRAAHSKLLRAALPDAYFDRLGVPRLAP
jgi:RNA-directed DNA polymerase